MKFGQLLERESVPQWRIHNIDYNTLKHEIKVHTTGDHEDASPGKFEDVLYNELCCQHSRVDMFVSSKADETSRHMDHLESSIQRWVARYVEEPASSATSLKRQQIFAKYERELLACSHDIHSLSRFCRAQVTAFRKILKKHTKWTGSPALAARFTHNVLNSFKSFTHRDFSPLLQRHDDILTKLHAAAPQLSEPSSPSDEAPTVLSLDSATRGPRVELEAVPPSELNPHPHIVYWNEYDNGSEAGDDYTIYVDPQAHSSFPGLGYVHAIASPTYEKVRGWFKLRRSSEERTLLLRAPGSASGSLGYASTSGRHADSDNESYGSSNGIPADGYATHNALTVPIIREQRMLRDREKALLFGTVGCFSASFLLVAIAAIVISIAKRKLHVEVDVGVSIGVMLSLLSACLGLGMTLHRNDPLSVLYRLMVWTAFGASCLLNGMLLILIIDNAP